MIFFLGRYVFCKKQLETGRYHEGCYYCHIQLNLYIKSTLGLANFFVLNTEVYSSHLEVVNILKAKLLFGVKKTCPLYRGSVYILSFI